jgi:hypothetical protein
LERGAAAPLSAGPAVQSLSPSARLQLGLSHCSPLKTFQISICHALILNRPIFWFFKLTRVFLVRHFLLPSPQPSGPPALQRSKTENVRKKALAGLIFIQTTAT